MESSKCPNCGSPNRAGAIVCAHCSFALGAPAPAQLSPPPTPSPQPAIGPTVVSHVEGQAVIIGDNARQQISYYGDIIVRVDSLEELPPKPGEPPYKGLTYYTEADAAIFFGREQLSDDLAARLETTAFLAVAGASGSGKSSLLRAGVIPRLRRRNWLIHVLTPTADPLTQLANSLTQDDADLAAADTLRAALAADPQTLRRAAEKRLARSDGARLLLIVDQFEELFTQCHDEAGRRAFIDNLLAAARDAGRITVLIGLRADFTGRLTEVEALRARVEQDFALLGPMQQEDLVRVIAEPARLGGWAFVSGLVEQILSDVGQEPGRLPLLSHALLETWKRRAGHVMTLRGYREAGGVEGAIAKTAEDTLRRLDEPNEQPIMQAIFLSLTELGEGSEDTRRIARRAELARAGDPAAVDAVLNTLAAARLVTVDETGVQVAHEALIRRWPRLREWLADNRERIRFERQLEADALEWQRLQRDTGALYRGARLAQAQEWTKAGHSLSPQVAEFLNLSAAEVKREADEREQEEKERIRQQEALRQEQQNAGRFKRLSRRLTAAAMIAVIATAIALIFAFVARNAQAEVERLNRETRSRRLAAEAENMLSRPDFEAALLLAAAAFQAPLAGGAETTAEARAALYHTLDSPFRGVLAGHESGVLSAVFSPDGTRLATASADGTARLWDAASGAELAVLAGHEDWVTSAVFSPDGTRLATASHDGTARLWDAASGAELAVLAGHESGVLSAVFSPDGTRLATASLDGTARLWDAASGAELAVLARHAGGVRSAAFSPDGTRLATASHDGTARLWDAASGAELAVLAGHESVVLSAVFSPDGTRLATASADGTARLWDAASGAELAVLAGHESEVLSAVFSPDGTRLATASGDGTARLWDAASGAELAVLAGHESGVLSAVFSPDGTRLATASVDGTARLWDAASGAELAVLAGHEDWVTSAVFSPDGTRLATASHDGTARLWDAASGAELAVLAGHESGVLSAVFSPDGTRLATASLDGTARLWDAASGAELAVLAGHESEVLSAVFSPDGTRLATASGDGTARLWDAASGAELAVLAGHESGVLSAVFSPDGTRLATASVDGTARLWDAASGAELAVLAGHEDWVTSAVFSPDGTRLATASHDGTARLWDAASGAELAVLAGHESGVLSAVFSPDGTRLATASLDGTARLWDAASGAELAVLARHAGGVRSAAFSPDGTRLATASGDGTARLWSLPPPTLMAEAQRRPWREPTAIIPDFCARYFQDAPDECPDTLAKLFPEDN